MGLDMYLYGRKYHWQGFGQDAPPDRLEDGKRVRTVDVDLGYWRKHPNLHGYFVQTFMDGRDECQEIELRADDLRSAIAAVTAEALPYTTGFFFGESYATLKGATRALKEEEKAEDLRILQGALDWLEASDVAPVELKPAVPIGGGFAIAEVKEDKTQDLVDAMAGVKGKQRITRSVHYHASW